MRIGIDCRLSGLQHAGIGRYTTNLVRELVQLDIQHQLTLFCNSDEQASELRVTCGIKPDDSSTNLVVVEIPHYSVREQIGLATVFNRAQLDLLHVPHFNVPLLYRRPYIVTIHDLLWHHHRGHSVTHLPAWQYWPKYLGYRFVASSAIRSARTIIVPSTTVKQTVATYYPDQEKKTVVIREGVTLAPAVKPQHRVFPEYLLYVGSLYPHKNVDTILHLLTENLGYHLLLVGARSIFSDQIKQLIHQLKLDKRVLILEKVSDGELHWLYQHAQVLIQPSSSEGFGLTGVEAMAAGTPVVASDIPIFKEVYAKHAYYFKTRDVSSLKQAVLAATASSQTHKHATKQHAAKFSWSKMAQSTLALYEQA